MARPLFLHHPLPPNLEKNKLLHLDSLLSSQKTRIILETAVNDENAMDKNYVELQ